MMASMFWVLMETPYVVRVSFLMNQKLCGGSIRTFLGQIDLHWTDQPSGAFRKHGVDGYQ